MADKKSYKKIQLRNRSKRTQLVTPAASLSSLLGGSSGSVNAGNTFRDSKKSKMGKKSEKEKQKGNGPPKERWLLTRKTWKYMTDAGRRLIPDSMQNRTTSDSQDLKKIEEYFQHVCKNESKFLPWRRKQSYPGALSASAFRRSVKSRSYRLFGRSNTGLAPISDTKSSGSSNFSSPPTKLNSAEGSDDEGGFSANESQRMFLIIEMLEKYLKLSNSTSPMGGNIDDEESQLLDGFNESSSSPNDYNSSTPTSPIRSENESSNKASVSPPPYQSYRSSGGSVGGNTSDQSGRKFRFDMPTSQKDWKSERNSQPYYGSSAASHHSRRIPINITGNHTSLLLENLRNYGRSNRSSLLSSLNFTPAVLEDKQLLRRIRDELKQQQLDSILRRHSRRPFSADTSNLRLSTSLFTLPTLKSTPSSNLPASKENFGINKSSTTDRTADIDSPTSPTQSSRVPLISIKLASQEKLPRFTMEGTQTDPIAVNHIYQLYYEYMKRQEKEQAEQAKNANAPLSKSVSTSSKASFGADTNKHSKRKSSIDNEDVSQSVSDTIKRYLRMARKKNTNENDANRFKRINYDTNLRNITSKAEIPKPDELIFDDTTKWTQTNDNWCELVIKEIKMHMGGKDAPMAEFGADFAQFGLDDSKQNVPPFTSVSTPTSPTGFFHTSTYTNL